MFDAYNNPNYRELVDDPLNDLSKKLVSEGGYYIYSFDSS